MSGKNYALSLVLLVLFYLILVVQTASAQDRVNGDNQPIDHTINPEKLSYDYLVDGNLSQNDPVHHRFKTLQAAYDAAPAGAEEKPTVIGIKPNVYQLKGGRETSSLRITKNYITLLGLTNNRRSVVLADNRGLQQGADDNGYMLDVDAVGFTAKNLTILNYCNVDYEYPGDPEKNLQKRSNIITQAVALRAAGDKHVYINVAILSRLDTMFLLADRSYFKNVYVEGTDDWVGGGGIGYWEDCTLVFPTGSGVMLSMNNVFRDCRFIAADGMQFYKVGFNSQLRPSTLINSIVPVSRPNTRVAWMREEAPSKPHFYSRTWKVKNTNGKAAKIYDSSAGEPDFKFSQELTAEQMKAFNPWNLLRAVPSEKPDNWDPAGVRNQYEKAGQGVLVYRIRLTDGSPEKHKPAPDGGTFHIRTGATTATIGAKIAPVYAKNPEITWSTSSDLIALNQSSGSTVTVSGRNTTEHAEWVPVKATAANGLDAMAWLFVEPAYVDPPDLISGPTLSPPANGRVKLNYKLDLKIKGREDQSLATWYISDNSGCGSEQKVAVSRGGEPLKSLPLKPGYIGKYIKVKFEPKSQRSEPGTPISAISDGPIGKKDIPKENSISPNFRNFVVIPDSSFADNMWMVSKNWEIERGETLENNFGIHSTGPASLSYQRNKQTGDMKLDLLFRPDKTAGQVFSVPGAPADEGTKNLHGDIYIKYNPRTGDGYSLRFWRTTQSAEKCMYQFYKIENGVGTPIDDQQKLSGFFKRNTHMILEVNGNKLTVDASNTHDNESLHMESTITPNNFGGAGMSWSRGTSAICSRFAISWR